MAMRFPARAALTFGLSLLMTLALAACAAGGGQTTVVVTATPSATATATPTATPQPGCAQILPSSTPFSGVSGVSGLSLPAGATISSGSASGGGVGQYKITTYTVCFQGAEAAIDGAGGVPNSSLAKLHAAGWALNNLFPDPASKTYLDFCSGSHNCANNSGVAHPFTFVSFSQYAGHSGGFTTFTLQVATIPAPICLNDVAYYSGTPKYTLFEAGNSASGSSQDHFEMPPATRVSTYQGGGTAGSTYVYFCSAGTATQVVDFLKLSMANHGWTLSAVTGSSFTAKFGSGPTYQIDVSVPGPNNYSLRIFVPM